MVNPIDPGLASSRQLDLAQVVAEPWYRAWKAYPGELLVTSWLCREPDPILGNMIDVHPSKLVLARSAASRGRPCVVLHDGLPAELVEDETSPFVQFVQVENRYWANPHHGRFPLIRNWLLERAKVIGDWPTFVLDLFDVRLGTLPVMDFVHAHPANLYLGVEEDRIGDGEHGDYLVKELKLAYPGEVQVVDGLLGKRILNHGIVGGRPWALLAFLSAVCSEFHGRGAAASGMGQVNCLARREPWPALVWAEGYPLHTPFRAQEPADSHVAFLHK